MRISELLILVIISLVGISAVGFFWLYSNQISFVPAGSLIASRQPIVLGEETLPGEEGLAFPKLDAAKINADFQKYCLRPANQPELFGWLGAQEYVLVRELKNAQVYIENYRGRYLDSCLGEVLPQ